MIDYYRVGDWVLWRHHTSNGKQRDIHQMNMGRMRFEHWDVFCYRVVGR